MVVITSQRELAHKHLLLSVTQIYLFHFYARHFPVCQRSTSSIGIDAKCSILTDIPSSDSFLSSSWKSSVIWYQPMETTSASFNLETLVTKVLWEISPSSDSKRHRRASMSRMVRQSQSTWPLYLKDSRFGSNNRLELLNGSSDATRCLVKPISALGSTSISRWR